ncbi:restriction endonuclease subunit S [Thalassolituus sp.]|uniref:restriction endonuclease subunit S n=1 Tax=Thalassolituus sp. TaxID=2030822 RepID=UPI003517A79E
MGSEWPKLPLADLVTIHDFRRKPVTKSQRKPGPYPYYGASGITDYVEDYIFEGEFVLLAEDGDNLRTRNTPIAFMATGQFWVNNHAHILQGADDLDTRYICYALQHAEVDSYISGSTRPKITQADLKKIPISAPPIEVRRLIASYITSIDNKIVLNRQINTTLESMAQALFKSWFVDFDPVIDNALAAGNEIPDELALRAARREALRQQTNETTGSTDAVSVEQALPETGLSEQRLPSEIQQLFPDRFVLTEEMGWVPEGWEIAPISTLANLNPEAWSNKNSPDYVKYVDLANAKNGRIDEVITYSFSESPSRARRVLRIGDTIFGTVRPGNRSFALIHEEGLTGSTGFAVLRPKTSDVTAFIYFAVTRQEVIDLFAHLADGAAYPAIRPDVVADHVVVIPPTNLLETFESRVMPMLLSIGSRELMNSGLSDLRDSLLPKLLSGQITIPDAEQQLAEVL